MKFGCSYWRDLRLELSPNIEIFMKIDATRLDRPLMASIESKAFS